MLWYNVSPKTTLKMKMNNTVKHTISIVRMDLLPHTNEQKSGNVHLFNKIRCCFLLPKLGGIGVKQI